MLFMLIDTADPRYRPREPSRGPRRRPKLRLGLWLPLIAGIACLATAGSASPILGYVLAMSSLGLFMRAGTALLPRGDGLPKHRQ